MSVTRALSGLGLSIASPAGFGIIGVNIRHEPARTIVFAAFGELLAFANFDIQALVIQSERHSVISLEVLWPVLDSEYTYRHC